MHNNLAKFGRVVFELLEQTDRPIFITILCMSQSKYKSYGTMRNVRSGKNTRWK